MTKIRMLDCSEQIFIFRMLDCSEQVFISSQTLECLRALLAVLLVPCKLLGLGHNDSRAVTLTPKSIVGEGPLRLPTKPIHTGNEVGEGHVSHSDGAHRRTCSYSKRRYLTRDKLQHECNNGRQKLTMSPPCSASTLMAACTRVVQWRWAAPRSPRPSPHVRLQPPQPHATHSPTLLTRQV